jgi:hypothetical protein
MPPSEWYLIFMPRLWPTAQNEGFSRYASSICTRLASSILDRESVVNIAISSSLITNSTASTTRLRTLGFVGNPRRYLLKIKLLLT